MVFTVTMPAGAPISTASSTVIPSEYSTVSQIRNAAALKTNKSVKGAAPIAAMNSLRRLADEAHLKEQQGDLKGALFQFVQVGVLLQFVQESHDYKQESQRGRHGALYQMMQEFQKGPFESMMTSVKRLQETLLQAERDEANRATDTASDVEGPRRPGASLADRFKLLQGNGVSAELIGRRIQRPPSQNFRPQSPSVAIPARLPTPGPFSPRRTSLSYDRPPPSPGPNGAPSSYTRPSAMPIASSTSPRTFVPISSFGPPSPNHSNESLHDDIDNRRPIDATETYTTSASDFSRAYPSIDELNERSPASMFPSVPTHIPNSAAPNGTSNGSARNGIPWKKQFPSLPMEMEPRPASTPIPIKRSSVGSRPTTPAHFSGSSAAGPGHSFSPRSPLVNGFNASDASNPITDIPISNAIAPAKLNSFLETQGLNILLLDVRNRDDFEKERINHDAAVCLEPTVLMRNGINSSMIEGSQVISPSTEQVLFKNRSKFDLIIMYDESSTTLGATDSPMNALSRAIFENEFHRPLKRPPMLLVGGLKAWKQAIGEEGILRRLSPTSNGFGSAVNGKHSPAPVQTNTTGDSTEETFVYQLAEKRYPPVEQIPTQLTGSSEGGTETPAGRKLTRRRTLSRSQAGSVNGQMSTITESVPEAPLVVNPPTLISIPGYTRPSPIQYPSAQPRTASPSPSSTQRTPLTNGSSQLQPPAAASVNPFPISRRRSDYAEQGQHAYSGGGMSIARPIDYPQLSAQNILPPPPAAATAASTRQDPRARAPPSTQNGTSQPTFWSPPMIQSDYPVVYWNDGDIGISGLKNLGNTCYMNSVLQCLSATAPFARFFIDGRWRSAVNMLNPLGSKGKFTEAYARMVLEMWQSDVGALTPLPFRKSVCTYAPQFADANQHDAQEFLIFLLDGLHEDLNRVLHRQNVEIRPEREAELEALSTLIASEQEWNLYRMRNNSIVVDYFQGQFRNRMECMTCHKTSTTYNTFMHLSLPLPSTRNSPRVSLQHCLDTFVQEEVMEKTDAWNCPNCKAMRRATKVLTLCRLPPILLIHLKRFSVKGHFTEKLETVIDFPLKGLDLTGYMPAALPAGADTSAMSLYGKPRPLTSDDPRQQQPPYKYDLFGVTNHYGTLSSGHYTSFVNSSGGWKFCDDSRITRTEPIAVVTKAAYILFYKRTR